MGESATSRAAGAGSRLGERDWVGAALRRLALGNIKDVRVEALARDLGVTKGSFYWHFRNRRELLEKMLERWKQRATYGVSARVRELSHDAREALEQLLSLPARTPPDKLGVETELAIRDWARTDAVASRAVGEIDRIRLAHMAEFFLDLGFAPDDAEQRASIALSFMLGNSLLKSGADRAYRIAQARACVAYLTRR